MQRSKWRVAISAIVLLVGVWTVYWYIVTRNLRDGVAAWRASLPTQAWQLDSTAMSLGGWPFRAAVTMANATLHHEPSIADIATPDATVSINLFQLDRIRIELAGPVHLRMGQQPDVILTGDALVTDIPLRGEAATGHFSGKAVRLESANGTWHATAKTLSVQVQADRVGAGRTSSATFATAAADLSLPSTLKWALGSEVKSIDVSGVLHGLVPMTGTPATAAAAWRDRGGSVDINRYAVAWGPLDLTGAATLKLDDHLQPAGTGTAHVIGYAQTLDRLAASGVMTNGAAVAAKAILALFAGSSGAQSGDKETGASDAIDVPLVLQYRTLSMRQVPLMQVPELDLSARQ